MPIFFTRRAILAAPAVVPWAGCSIAEPSIAQPTASILDFVPQQYHAPIRDGVARGDLTNYFTRALVEHDSIHVPTGRYPVSSIRIASGKTLTTDGPATRFAQVPTVAHDASVLLIEGSNVAIGDCTIEGIIHLFRPGGSEFNHGIHIRARRGAAPVRQVRLGSIVGRNLRGDVVMVHCQKGALLDGVTIGNVYGHNILRNIVAVVGGRNIAVGDIDGTACGYASLDLEPEGTYSAPVEGVRVRSVRGAVCAIQANPDTYISDVEIGRLDTDPRHMPDSSPAYVDKRGRSLHDDLSGLVLRNATGVVIASHRARGHGAHAVRSIDDPRRRHSIERSVTVGSIDYADIGQADSTYLALINALALDRVTILGGTASLAHDGQSLALGNSETATTRCRIENVRLNGLVARHVTQSEFHGLQISAPRSRGALQNVRTSRFSHSTVRAGYLGYNVSDTVFERTTFTGVAGGPYVLGGNVERVRFRAGTVNGRRLDDELFTPSVAAQLNRS